MKCSIKLLGRRETDPFLQNFPIRSQQEDVRAKTRKFEFSPEGLGCRIVDIEIREPNLGTVIRLEPMHDGRHRLAGTSPKCEKFDNLGLARSQDNRSRIRCFEALARH